MPCYVIDSTKPVWQGDDKNCGMIMGTNVFVFNFVFYMQMKLLIDSVKQLESTKIYLSRLQKKCQSTHLLATYIIEYYKPVQLGQHLAELHSS